MEVLTYIVYNWTTAPPAFGDAAITCILVLYFLRRLGLAVKVLHRNIKGEWNRCRQPNIDRKYKGLPQKEECGHQGCTR